MFTSLGRRVCESVSMAFFVTLIVIITGFGNSAFGRSAFFPGESDRLLAQTPGTTVFSPWQRPKSCPTTTLNNCDLPETASGSAAGTCSSGYAGTCSYSCFRGNWTESSNTCVVAGCTLPWGGFLPDGQSVTAYSTPNPSGSCSSVSETRTCVGGVLSGSYTYGSCNDGCASQTYSWTIGGKTCSGTVPALAHGGGTTVTDSTEPTTGSRTVTCQNGSLTGSGGSCVESCALPWGGRIAHGQSVVAYYYNGGGCYNFCDYGVPQTRTCNNGVLSGTATYQSACAAHYAACPN